LLISKKSSNFAAAIIDVKYVAIASIDL
jgi:hypothetical protein